MEGLSQFLEDLRMTPAQAVLVGLFLLAWVLCFLSWIVGLLEYWGIRRLSKKFFGVGPVMWRAHENLPPPTAQPGTRLDLPSTRLKVTEPNRLVFAPLGRTESGARSAPLLKGEVKWEGELAEITVRASFAQLAFMTGWLSLCVIWVVTALTFSLPRRVLVIPALMFVGGVLMLRHSLRSARKTSRVLGAEISEHLGAG